MWRRRGKGILKEGGEGEIERERGNEEKGVDDGRKLK